MWEGALLMTGCVLEDEPGVLADGKVLDIHFDFTFLICVRVALHLFHKLFILIEEVCLSVFLVVSPDIGEGDLDIALAEGTELLIDV